MTARSSMIHRAVLQSQATTTDDYGQVTATGWTTVETIPCFAWSSMKTHVLDNEKTVIVEDFRATVPRGTAITDENRFLNITDRQDVEIFAGPLLIRTIQVKSTHLELSLEKIDSGVDVDLPEMDV